MFKNYDFAGYVTKNDVKCADGLTIKHGAFKHQHETKVPLVWQHDHGSPEMVVGHMLLENRENGVYGYGFLNETDMGSHSKELIRHGDVNSLSIWANKIKRVANDVVHGTIREVSLVLAGANPGAKIDFINLEHSEDATASEAVIWTDNVIHSAEVLEELLKHEFEVDKGVDKTIKMDPKDEVDKVIKHAASDTVSSVLKTLDEKQMHAVGTLVEELIKEQNVKHDALEEDNPLKTNLFDKKEELTPAQNIATLQHSVFATMYKDNSTLQEALVVHQEEIIAHGIDNIEMLFPDAQHVGDKPYVYAEQHTAYEQILAKIKKVPFARLKNLIADFTEDDARALGYKKGDKKIDQIFKLMGRETYPQTIYKKQSYDRDDVVDITEIDLIAFTRSEMRMMLNRELARACLVGDGREESSPHKIKADKIRPVIGDDEFYTIPKTYTDTRSIITSIIKAMSEYRGSGTPDLYMHPNLIADLRLLTAEDGRFLFGDIPTVQAMAARLGVAEIIPSTFLKETEFVIINFYDYSLGANKGGQVTTFDDFDIDFNKLKYLIETRCSGSLMTPKSAIHFTQVVTPPEGSGE